MEMQGFAGKFSTVGMEIWFPAQLHPKFLENFPSKRAPTLQNAACRTFAKEKSKAGDGGKLDVK